MVRLQGNYGNVERGYCSGDFVRRNSRYCSLRRWRRRDFPLFLIWFKKHQLQAEKASGKHDTANRYKQAPPVGGDTEP